MLYIKSILKPKSKEDGVRLSVMSRHALDDGFTMHPEITIDFYVVGLWFFGFFFPDNFRFRNCWLADYAACSYALGWQDCFDSCYAAWKVGDIPFVSFDKILV